MSSKSRFKMKLLPRVVDAEVAEPRHVRYLARDTLPRPLEKHAKIHTGGIPLSGKTARPFFPLNEIELGAEDEG